MALQVTPSFDALIAKLCDFIAPILPDPPNAPPVVQMPANRTSMPPPVPGFVGLVPRLQSRIMTNINRWDLQDPAPTAIEVEQAVRVEVACNFYGAAAADWATMFATVFRDEYGCRGLAPIAAPLYCEDPIFAPLIDGEEEYESRWIVRAFMQYNPVTSTPMQFSDTLEANLINVDVEYPP
jgi:hypothetical protein